MKKIILKYHVESLFLVQKGNEKVAFLGIFAMQAFLFLLGRGVSSTSF